MCFEDRALPGFTLGPYSAPPDCLVGCKEDERVKGVRKGAGGRGEHLKTHNL